MSQVDYFSDTLRTKLKMHTLYFMPQTNISQTNRPTHTPKCFYVRLHNPERRRRLIIACADRLNFTGNVATPIASMTTMKTILNKATHVDKACSCNLNFKYFYLSVDLDDYE